ncbi:YhgE/Pip domain-containing protein [Subtercola lobariae]|uniref:Membrane protein n=1 Tax=Subtercola lobariae TaxID=1588641 RepID=A0A917B5Q7_9MICO|nr:ABC transporter permease [Subtercola lobariae]GGF22738.1 membrane protein [Subtercola lobariae]
MATYNHTDDLTQKTGLALLASARLWAVPAVIVIGVMSALAALYLGGTINSSSSLSGFPIAIVNEDTGDTLPDGTTTNVGDKLTSALVAGIDHDKFDVSTLTLDEAKSQMDDATLYGAIVVPADYSTTYLAHAASASTGSAAAPAPTITVLTNPRSGTSTAAIVTAMADQSLAQTGATISVEPYNPLPNGTGSGLSAFYFALLIVLCGFTGSLIVSTFVDGSLGFVPSEVGPVYTLTRHSGLSRASTLILKWAIMLGLAVVVSGLYVAIASALGMPIDNPLQLWAFSAAAIWAVAIVAQAVNAIFGGIGMLVNLFIFIILSLPSAGGTIPLEATPPLFRWLGSFEPMHQIYLGTRSVLYLGGTLESGLGRALIFCGITAVVGVIAGLLATRLYDRRGLTRSLA